LATSRSLNPRPAKIVPSEWGLPPRIEGNKDFATVGNIYIMSTVDLLTGGICQ
jgi:hypothetical protein